MRKKYQIITGNDKTGLHKIYTQFNLAPYSLFNLDVIQHRV